VECTFREGIVTLRAETDEEHQFLEAGFKEGLRNSGGGSTNTLVLPSRAGLQQFHLNKKETIILAYSLGHNNIELCRIYGAGEVRRLTKKLLTTE